MDVHLKLWYHNIADDSNPWGSSLLSSRIGNGVVTVDPMASILLL